MWYWEYIKYICWLLGQRCYRDETGANLPKYFAAWTWWAPIWALLVLESSRPANVHLSIQRCTCRPMIHMRILKYCREYHRETAPSRIHTRHWVRPNWFARIFREYTHRLDFLHKGASTLARGQLMISRVWECLRPSLECIYKKGASS